MFQYTRTLIGLFAVCLVGGLLVGGLAGGVGPLVYVETGSMAPVLAPGDGLVVVPAGVAGQLGAGDVVVFESLRPDAPRYVTHRVVAATDGGYLTKGDANPFVDQAGDEPIVTTDRVVAVAPSFAGRLVVVPGVGPVVERIGRFAPGLRAVALLALGWVVLDAVRGAGDGRRTPTDRVRERPRRRPEVGVDPRRWLAVVAVLLAVAIAAGTVVPSGDRPVPGVTAGVDGEYTTTNAGLVPVVAVLDACDAVSIADPVVVVPPRGRAVTRVTAAGSPPPACAAVLTEHRSLPVLPPSLLVRLHALNPWLLAWVSVVVVAGGFYLASAVIVGRRRLRLPRRHGRRVRP
jgi:signal peptidase